MARPMIYPMGDMEIRDKATMPSPNKGDAKRINRNVSQYGIRHGKAFKCRTVEGVTFITRLV